MHSCIERNANTLNNRWNSDFTNYRSTMY